MSPYTPDQDPRYVPYENPAVSTNRLRRLYRSCSGRAVGLAQLPHSIPSFLSAVRRKVTGVRPRLPFIPYAAIPEIERRLGPTSYVVEVGAGMSTLWMCSRVGRIRSLEWDRAWLDRLDSEIRREQRDNVDLRLCTGRAETEFADIADHSVDFVFIDGGPRPYCLAKLWPKLRPGGSAYLDNWDSDVFWMEDLNARLFLDDRAGEIARRTLFVDYVPTQVAVSEGLLLDKGD